MRISRAVYALQACKLAWHSECTRNNPLAKPPTSSPSPGCIICARSTHTRSPAAASKLGWALDSLATCTERWVLEHEQLDVKASQHAGHREPNSRRSN